MLNLINDLYYWWIKRRICLCLFLIYFLNNINFLFCAFTGGLINGYTRLTLVDSPYYIKENVVVEKNGELRIDPGVILYFLPRKGITVFGKLSAKGTYEDKILFTIAPNSNIFTNFNVGNINNLNSKSLISTIVNWPTLRLVDGLKPSEGRLQINYHKKWHSVCTNSKNWTQTDTNIICRQLGFNSGVWYQWYQKNNDSLQFMLENPACNGNEAKIEECSNWNKKAIGSGICDYHFDIGIKCDTEFYFSPNFWSGIRFLNAESEIELVRKFDNKMRRQISKSILQNIVIEYAGENNERKATPAVFSIGVPPEINSISIKWSASTALNITDPKDSFSINNSYFIENRGYGIFINTTWGSVELNNVKIDKNGADGIRYVLNQDFLVGHDFCQFTKHGQTQVYPVSLTYEQIERSLSRIRCCQVFELPKTLDEARLTVHFTYLMNDNIWLNEEEKKLSKNGFIEIFDGYKQEFIAKLVVKNNTYPASFTSSQNRIQICYTPGVFKKSLFTLIALASNGKAYDLNITKSVISNNNGRGIWIQNQNSGLVVNHSVIANNSYISGIHSINGVGDLIINNTIIRDNIGDGLNISLANGYRHIDRTLITGNTGRGIAFYFNESISSPYFAENFKFVHQITYSEISNNLDVGLLIGNVCRSDSFWNISMNHFVSNFDDAILFQSCWNSYSEGKQTIYITHNKFNENQRLAINMAPLLHIKNAIIKYNEFTFHQKGVIYINNYDFLLDDLSFEVCEVNVKIHDNYFSNNKGYFVVNLGLNDNSLSQKIVFSKNILNDNSVHEPYEKLNPRNRVSAVVAVSSSNTIITRNNLNNPNSNYEIGVHLDLHSKTINATYNYFGTFSQLKQTLNIYKRIFDRKNRYNLALVEYLPYRIDKYDFDSNEFILNEQEKEKRIIFLDRNKILGGEIRGYFSLKPGSYLVLNDIFVAPNSVLTLKENTTLEFDYSIGMMVQGDLEIKTSINNPVRFTGIKELPSTNYRNIYSNKYNNDMDFKSDDDKGNDLTKISVLSSKPSNFTFNNFEIKPNFNLTEDVDKNFELKETKSRTLKDKYILKKRKKRNDYDANKISNVRLSNLTEGRVEIQINGEWGSICSYNFDLIDAAIVCQQLGLVLNSKNWLLKKNEYVNSINLDYVIISNVGCTKFDYDISLCKSEKKFNNDFENSCFSEIGIRCNKPSWSGLRFGIASKSRTIENIIVENAGLLDYSTNIFKPALQVDFNKHQFRNIKIVNNLDSGLGIMWNNIFNKDNLIISDSDISSNGNHGIVTSSQGLEIRNCYISFNKKSGFNYYPMFTNYEQRELISWISPSENKNLINLPENLPQNSSIYIKPNHSWFIHIQRPNKTLSNNISFQVETNFGHSIGIFILNSINPLYTDNLLLKYRDKQWNLRKNLTSFTMVHYVFKFNLIYIPGDRPMGKIIFYLHSKPIIVAQSKSLKKLEEQENYQLKTIKCVGNKFINNAKAFTSYHFNKDKNRFGDHFHRYDNETFFIYRNLFENNYEEVIHVNSMIYDFTFSKLSKINYTLIENEFHKNQKGIVHTSNSFGVNSNNLFHWTINSSLISDNFNGGLNIYLPYVWQYDKNNTHSISLNKNIFINNQNFEFILNGHFSKLKASSNIFRKNDCKNGLISIYGMEKELLIENNIIEDNFGNHMVEFNLQNHADKFGLISASFQYNKILNNKNHFLIKSLHSIHPFNYAIAIRGVQYINITRNLFNNQNLNYEFLAGVLTGNINNKINVRNNWWGIYNQTAIKDRIFDFDDWNSYALASFKPFLVSESFDSISIEEDNDLNYDYHIDLEKPFGGRMYKDLRLTKKSLPYIIKSDLTIMPEATLYIDPGVILEFYPNIGILCLGNVYAVGSFEEPIIMRSLQKDLGLGKFSQHSKREIESLKKEKINEQLSNDIRLCKSVYCEEWNSQKDINNGFIEIYNSTTLQWIPVCDSTFTENNAQVICHQLGYSTLNVHLKFGKRLNMDQALLSKIKFWPQSLECNGKENNINECNLYNNDFINDYYYSSLINVCNQESDNFVFIYCGEEFKKDGNDYWGGLRFTLSDFENHQTDNFYLSKRIHFTSDSRLYNIMIINAGMLHGEKNAAIQIVQRDLNLGYVTINGSAYHGIEIISPNGHLLFDHLNIYNNLGSALNYLLLDGAANKNLYLPYKPTKISTLPYNVFSLVDVCDINKNLIVDQRILIYYKYSSKPVDCVKIFQSSRPSEKVAFRILQINFFNSTNIVDQTDFLRIYDGDLFNYTSKLIGDIGVKEFHRQTNPQNFFYQSSFESLSIRLHASSGRYEFGFIGEIVTSTTHFFGGALYNNITFSVLKNNVQGALTYRSIGEASPILSIIQNTIKSNCLKLFANFTTCKSAFDIEVQNSPFVLIESNLFENNIGGINLNVNAHYLGAALKGSLISNNLFRKNFINEILVVRAMENNDFFQFVNIYRNYFTSNISPFKDNIVISQMLCNFTQNIVVKNKGLHQLSVQGFDLNSHLYQEIHGNWLYNNFATRPGERSTILANSAGQHYLKNYFVNPGNDFEISTVNKSKLKNENYFIDARNNWWGFGTLQFVIGRIRDYLNNPDYIRVNFDNFLSENSSLLSSICLGGWTKIGDTCFLYVSARMNFAEANTFCEQENSTMPFVNINHEELTQFVSGIDKNYDKHFDSFWIQSFQYSSQECTVLLNEETLIKDCFEKLPFLCEKDLFVRSIATYENWMKDNFLISVFLMSILIAILVLICFVCWLCKSRERYKEKMERRNSIRASIRSNRSYTLSSNSLNEVAYKKQIEKVLQMAREQQQHQNHYGSNYLSNNNYSLSTLNENNFNTTNDQLIQIPNYNTSLIDQQNHLPSTFRVHKVSQAGSYESFHENNLHHNNQAFINEISFEEEVSTHNYNSLRPVNKLEDRFANDAGLENANIELLMKPTFDLTYENAGFKETPTMSLDSEYADAREWTPIQDNNFHSNGPLTNQSLKFKKKKSCTKSNSNNNNINKKFVHKPLPPVTKYRNQHTLSYNSNQMLPQKSSLPYDLNLGLIDQFNTQSDFINHNLYKFQSRSQSTLLDARSDITAETAISNDRKYLETSLDNSIMDNAIDYYENSNRYSSNTSMATASTNRSRPPMETAM